MKQTAVEWLAIYLKGITSLNCDEVIAKAKEMEREHMIGFHKWMLENDTEQNAEKHFHFTDNDMLDEYYKWLI